MRMTFCLTFICLMEILSNANATKGKYTVIAPGTIHCNEKYTAAVAVHHTILPCRIKVGLSNPFYKQTKEAEVPRNEVKNVTFVLPCFVNGDINLTAESIGCLHNFKNTTKLIYKKFNSHVVIQTDKKLYAPEDEINFRVLFLNKDLRAAKPEKDAVIWFEDGKRNRINEIKDFKMIKGVYSGKFKITELPIPGEWCLGVSNGGKFNHTVYFKVNKYILPKFVVKVEPIKSVSVKDDDIHVIIRSNYNDGKPLDGKVVLISIVESNDYSDNREPLILGRTAEMIQGKANISLNIKEYDAYFFYKNSQFYMTIVATVEEKFTGVKINGTTSTTIYPYRHSIKYINYNASTTFDVQKENNVLFQITYLDGSYLNDTKSTIELIYKGVLRKNHWWHRELILNTDTLISPLSENRTVSFHGHMNETGFVSFKVALPELPQYEGYSHYYSLELKYLNQQHVICSTHLYWDQKQFTSPNNNNEETPKEYFTLEDKYSSDDKLYVKKASEFTINSSQPLSYFDYNIIGRGNILESGRIVLPDKPKVYNLTLTPQFRWVPNFCVYVNYVDRKGRFYFTEQSYEVVFELKNQIKITVAKQVHPGKEVALKIKTTANSFVGLMAIDHTAFLLSSDSGLKSSALNTLLGSYDTYTPPQGGYSTYPGEISGCVTLTNAHYVYNRTWPKSLIRDLLVAANKGASIKSTSGEASYATNLKAPEGFSATWMFADIEYTEVAEFNWTLKIPETVTSWVLTAFSLNPQKGLGITREQTKITPSLPFFISIGLPYSIKRGEVINVPPLVFNYLDKALDVVVIMNNTYSEYEFIEFDNKVINKQTLFKTVSIPANEAAGVSFLIKPKIVGNVMLIFTIISQVAGDTIHKSMKVVPEGITQYTNRAYFVNLKNESEFKSSFKLDLPKNLLRDSEHVEMAVMGDILGPVFNNLDDLMRLPANCGEQTISTLLTIYFVMKYLKDLKRLTPTLETNLRYKLETGYLNMLFYRHSDGSFSSFGPAQKNENFPNGSTWLTAYVVGSLLQINDFINIDGEIIEKGLVYLTNQQVANGTYTEKGDYLYAIQRSHVTLTCSAVLAIMENASYAEKYSEELIKGLDFIAHNINKSDSWLVQAMGTFTLNKAKHPKAKDEIYKLVDLAKTGLDRSWWSAEEQPCGRRCWFNLICSDVAISSYVLLTLLQQESTTYNDVLPVTNWLIAQRNSKGGFDSTQDTVIGLTALIEFMKFADYEPANITVVIESKERNETISLTEDNRIFYQNIQMPLDTKLISFTAKGSGLALIQIASHYNIFERTLYPSFTIANLNTRNKSRPLHLEILVCVKYKGEGESTNMALMEFSAPSGYVIDDGYLKQIMKLRPVSHAELKNSDSLLLVYFNHLYKNNKVCLTFEALRTHAVTMQKPDSIVIYDYYDTSKRATDFYEIESKLCDICETEEECSKCI